jgi:hypothetical protein
VITLQKAVTAGVVQVDEDVLAVYGTCPICIKIEGYVCLRTAKYKQVSLHRTIMSPP